MRMNDNENAMLAGHPLKGTSKTSDEHIIIRQRYLGYGSMGST
jgi:hypothetical protein